MSTKAAEIPFPFFGAGDAAYFEWCFVDVHFISPPTAQQKSKIASLVPPPLRKLTWSKNALEIRSRQSVHLDIAETYGGKRPKSERAFASETQVRAFNDAIDKFLIEAAVVKSIAFAFRRVDMEAGGTKLSAWHYESLKHVPQFLPRILKIEDDGVKFEILRMADVAKIKLPRAALDFLRPGEREMKLLHKGEGALLRAALAGQKLSVDEVETIVTKFPGKSARARRALLDVADLILKNAELTESIWWAFCIASVHEKDHPNRKMVIDAATTSTDPSVRAAAYVFLDFGEVTASFSIFSNLLTACASDTDDVELPLGCLRCLCAPKSGLPIPAALAVELAARCLSWEKKHPAIRAGAARVCIRAGMVDEAFHHLESGLRHFSLDDQLTHKDFAALKKHPRWHAIFNSKPKIKSKSKVR